MKNLFALLQRHAQAFWYVLTVVVPIILRTGKRPVIFSRFAGMGDILNSIPAALELKKRHPGATFIYNCDVSSACLPRMGGVTEFVTHCRDIGLVSHWYRRLLCAFYSFSSDDDQFTADHSELFLLSYARRHGVMVTGEHPRLSLTPELMEQAMVLRKQYNLANRPLILIHTGPSYPVKHWPHEAWAVFVEKIRAATGGAVAQLGARAGSYADAAADDFRPVLGAVSLVNQLSLPETVALIAQADLFVGLDSGLLHLAATMRTPAVGLWGPTSAKFLFLESEAKFFVTSAAECQGCHHRVPRLHWFTGCPHAVRCMQEISPENVLRAGLAALATRK